MGQSFYSYSETAENLAEARGTRCEGCGWIDPEGPLEAGLCEQCEDVTVEALEAHTGALSIIADLAVQTQDLPSGVDHSYELDVLDGWHAAVKEMDSDMFAANYPRYTAAYTTDTPNAVLTYLLTEEKGKK